MVLMFMPVSYTHLDVYKRQVANIATFLASDMSSYVSGQVIQVDGGMNM